jgi:hypothetical protein
MGDEEKPYKCPGYVDNPDAPGNCKVCGYPRGSSVHS